MDELVPAYHPLPDYDELVAWIAGEVLSMPLNEDEKQRIREIELVRAQAQREVMQALGGFAGGPVMGSCTACGKPMRAAWRFCAFCGAPSATSCPRCHFPRPQEDGVQFCPQCGGRF